MLIFGTADGLNFLQNSDNLFIDGTFAIVPPQLTQLYTVHGLSQRRHVVGAYHRNSPNSTQYMVYAKKDTSLERTTATHPTLHSTWSKPKKTRRWSVPPQLTHLYTVHGLRQKRHVVGAYHRDSPNSTLYMVYAKEDTSVESMVCFRIKGLRHTLSF